MHISKPAVKILAVVEVAENCVAPPLPHNADSVWTHLGQKDSHGPFGAEGAHDDVGSCEPNCWTCHPDDHLDGHGDIDTSNL